MTERKTESEPREEDEDLKLEKEKLRDLELDPEATKNVRGGKVVNSEYLRTDFIPC